MDWVIEKDKQKETELDHYYYEREKKEKKESDTELAKDYDNARDYAKVYVGENVMYEGVATYNDDSVYLSTETLKKVIPRIKGRPVVVEHHAGITPQNMQDYAVGYVTDGMYNAETGRFDVKFVVWDDYAKNLLDNEGYTLSTSYIAKNFTGGACCINTPYENEITDLDFTHLAIVKNPRYEKVKVYENSKTAAAELQNGGEGAGDFAHGGRPGKVGGSATAGTGRGAAREKTKLEGAKKPEGEEKKYIWKGEKYTLKGLLENGFEPIKKEEDFYLKKEDDDKEYRLFITKEKYLQLLKHIKDKQKNNNKDKEKQNSIMKVKEVYNMEKIAVSKGFMAGLLNLAGKVFSNAIEDGQIEEITDEFEVKEIKKDAKDGDKKVFVKDEKEDEKEDEKKNDKVDKRKLIDEVGGILKEKVDEAIWRTVIKKIEEIAYDADEDEDKDKETDVEERQNGLDFYDMMNKKMKPSAYKRTRRYTSFDALQNGNKIYGKRGV